MVRAFLAIYLLMMGIQIPLAAVIDVAMGGWGLSREMLLVSWVVVIAVETFGYWAAVIIWSRIWPYFEKPVVQGT